MAGQSISRRQQRVLDTSFIDLLGEDASNFTPVSFDAVQDALYNLGQLYIETATDKLNKADKVSSGFLADSIQALPVEIFGKVYSLSINIADYYKFIDQGVDGWNKAQGSPFKFKRYSGKSGQKNSAMVTAIRKWAIREGLQSNAKHKPITSRERKRKSRSMSDTSTTTAIIISKAVKKNGLKPTHFWTQTQDTVTNAAAFIYGEAIKIDIINAFHGNSNK